MNILVLTPYVAWPLDHGGRIRTHHLLRALARDHEIVNVAVARAPRDRDDAEALARRSASRSGPASSRARTCGRPAQRLGKWISIASRAGPRCPAAGGAPTSRRWCREASVEDAVRPRGDRDSLWMDVYRPSPAGFRSSHPRRTSNPTSFSTSAGRETGLAPAIGRARRRAARSAARPRCSPEPTAAIAVSADDAATRIRTLAPGRARLGRRERRRHGPHAPSAPARRSGPMLFVGSFDYPANVDAATILVNGGAPPRPRALAGRGRHPRGPQPAARDRGPRARSRRRGRRHRPGPRTRSTTGQAPSSSRSGSAAARASRSSRRSPIGRPVVTTAAGMRGLAVRHEHARARRRHAGGVRRRARAPRRRRRARRAPREDRARAGRGESRVAGARRQLCRSHPGLGQTRRSE